MRYRGTPYVSVSTTRDIPSRVVTTGNALQFETPGVFQPTTSLSEASRTSKRRAFGRIFSV